MTPIVYQEGAAEGVRAWQVRTGGGLRFAVRLDRGLEISEAEYLGVPYGWETGVGPAHPRSIGGGPDRWLKLYAGGLMTLGGLDQIGEPCTDQGQHYGLHGEVALLAAHDCGYRVDWQEREIRLWGTLRQGTPTRECLQLRREIVAPIGGSSIEIIDRVSNEGHQEAAHMILYHLNLGYPLLDVGSRFVAPIMSSHGWDAASEAHLSFSRTVPEMNGEEYVFGHQVTARDGWATAALVNERLGEGGSFCAVRWRTDTLPFLWQWLSLRRGTWVMGIEPANGDIGGRKLSRERKTLCQLAPGEVVQHRVQLRFGSGTAALGRLLQEAAPGQGEAI